ncbi:hypothetical protein [uncultured Rubinisphaera sp.]|uniref:hypothetical protein n=1 Tax=uncultured Rubinisphaera sp. TaxID=1678686 RepID=UPI000EDA5B7E|nr:hypothetical protein [Planctomycetaceae bacterium]|tara:strand:+ start:883 stop:1284 length:402 start_codon:yes stop_codon:yes gene_type:complete
MGKGKINKAYFIAAPVVSIFVLMIAIVIYGFASFEKHAEGWDAMNIDGNLTVFISLDNRLPLRENINRDDVLGHELPGALKKIGVPDGMIDSLVEFAGNDTLYFYVSDNSVNYEVVLSVENMQCKKVSTQVLE